MNTTSRNSEDSGIEARLAARLAGTLTQATQNLPHDVSERLRVARQQALARAREVRLAVPAATTVAGVSAAGALTVSGFWPRWQRAASLLPLVLLLVGLIAIDQWMTREQVLTAAEIDAQLLSDDLPPAAYTDPGLLSTCVALRPMKPSLRTLLAGLMRHAGRAGGCWAARRGAAWSKLTAAQKQVLAPLQRDWPGLDAQRREKWVEVASRFNTLPAEEQVRVKERMVEWARMTPAQRTRARLVFQEARQLPADERQARWQAYRSLSPEARQALAQQANPPARPAAGEARTEPQGTNPAANAIWCRPVRQPPPAIAPTVVQARPGATTTPMATKATPPLHHQAGLPKIAATPTFVDQATLLPKRGPQGAAARSVASREPASQP
jgi:hypothetical protein